MGEALRSGLVDSSVKGLHKFASIGPCDKAEYALLVVRQLHARKVDLRCWVCGGGAIFSVGNKDSDKLREIWGWISCLWCFCEASVASTSAHTRFFVAGGMSAWSAAPIVQKRW